MALCNGIEYLDDLLGRVTFHGLHLPLSAERHAISSCRRSAARSCRPMTWCSSMPWRMWLAPASIAVASRSSNSGRFDQARSSRRRTRRAVDAASAPGSRGRGRARWRVRTPLAECAGRSGVHRPGRQRPDTPGCGGRVRLATGSSSFWPVPGACEAGAASWPGGRLQILKGWDYGGCGSRVSPVWAKKASTSSGRYWIRLSRFFTIAASWSMPCTIRFPRLRLTWDHTCSVGLRSGA